jgi:hypothetical protein
MAIGQPLPLIALTAYIKAHTFKPVKRVKKSFGVVSVSLISEFKIPIFLSIPTIDAFRLFVDSRFPSREYDKLLRSLRT